MTDKILIDRSVVEQALKALEKADRISGYRNNWAEVNSLIAALAQPQAEQATDGGPNLLNPAVRDELAISWGYVKPQPPRQPLTEEEIAYCIFEARLGAEGAFKRNGSSSYRIARAIERAHGIGGEA